MNKANSYQWYNNMKEAEKSLKLTEKAINLEPNTWDGYALELNIYSTWNHKSKDFSSNFTALKFVYEKWIANGNKLSISQQLGYANTLFCLNNKIKSDLLYFEII